MFVEILIIQTQIFMTIIKNDKISKNYHPNHRSQGTNTEMFKEDFHRNIVSSYRTKDNVKCFLEPDNKIFDHSIIEAFSSINGYYDKTLNSLIIKTIEFIASNIVNFGSLTFELVKCEDINNKIHYKFIPIYFDKLNIKRKNIEQVFTTNGRVEKVLIPKNKCYVIEFPKSLGGTKDYLKFIKYFTEIDNLSPMLSFFNNPLSNLKTYDISLHQKKQELELWKKSKFFYWPHRSSLGYDKNFSQYYSIYRQLQFSRTKIILRDHIIENLKEILKSLSDIMNTESILKIEGLITLNNIEEKIEQWEKGKLDYEEIRDVII